MQANELHIIYNALRWQGLLKPLAEKHKNAQTVKNAFMLPTTYKKQKIISEALELLKQAKADKQAKTLIKILKEHKN